MIYCAQQAELEDRVIGLISVSLPADGSTADVADYNVPITTIVTLANGNIDNANIATGAAIDGAKLADASVTNAKLATALQAWTSWTPTWVNLTVNNGVNASKYVQIGKTVFFRLSFILGSGSSVGTAPTFTLPVTSVAYPGTATTQALGNARLFHTATAVYNGVVVWNTTTTGLLQSFAVSGSDIRQNGITATVPFTWANTDEIYAEGFYEAA